MKTLLIGFLSILAMGSIPKKQEPSKVVPIQDVAKPVVVTKPAPPAPTPTEKPVDAQEALVTTAYKYTYVYEKSGPNRSKEIDAWNKACGVALGSPYCASFQSAVHKEAGVPAIMSAWSPAWFTASKAVPFSKLSKGDVVGLYYKNLGRVGHILMVDKIEGQKVYTVEANTSPTAAVGSNADRDGDGVFRKIRAKSLIAQDKNKYARYWK